ncbi:MAG: hypothetical protein AAF485_06565 [Chloroflexota bacterium]
MAKRIFIFTLLWIGFILAISFMEAPLKFQAPSLTLPVGLEIGYLVFHALNGVEIFYAIVITILTFRIKTPSRMRYLTVFIMIWLAMQTVLLYTVLDARTLAIINGEEVPEAPYHLIYIGMEVAKLCLLIWLTGQQINWFEAQIRKSEI